MAHQPLILIGCGPAAHKAFGREFLTNTYGVDAAKAIERTIIHPWGTDPATMDSYLAAKVGEVGARATLAQSLDDRLYFAGEAGSTSAHSSLHGAYLTGRSAALQIKLLISSWHRVRRKDYLCLEPAEKSRRDSSANEISRHARDTR